MNYCGDTDEDCTANEVFSKLVSEDELNLTQKFIAQDYFKWGWEAALEWVKKVER
jgi:hypothetical protein